MEESEFCSAPDEQPICIEGHSADDQFDDDARAESEWDDGTDMEFPEYEEAIAGEFEDESLDELIDAKNCDEDTEQWRNR